MSKKHHDVLVLNRAFVPMHIIDWKDCMTHLVRESAHAVDREFMAYTLPDWINFSMTNAEDYSKIKTVRYPIAIPEVITLTRYDRLPDKEVKYSRENLFKVYKYKCCYCGKSFKERELEIEHVIPKSKGGKSLWTNTVTACRPCNQQKANRTPEEAGMHLLVKPAKPKWLNPLTHISWDNHPCKSWEHFINRV